MSGKHVIGDAPEAGSTFKERSLWATVIATAAIYAYYFWRALDIGRGNPVAIGVLFVQVVLAMIAIQVVVHIALVVHRRPEPADERDRQVAVRGARNAYYVLMTGTWAAITAAALSLGAFWFAHAALLAVVVAELTRCASQLVYYRRGI